MIFKGFYRKLSGFIILKKPLDNGSMHDLQVLI